LFNKSGVFFFNYCTKIEVERFSDEIRAIATAVSIENTKV
jgi:hypothetical protein